MDRLREGGGGAQFDTLRLKVANLPRSPNLPHKMIKHPFIDWSPLLYDPERHLKSDSSFSISASFSFREEGLGLL